MTSADSYSGEVAAGNSMTAYANWIKSSHSAQNGNCLEAALFSADSIAIRDSKDTTTSRAVLVFSRSEWRSLLQSIRNGELDI